MTDSKTLYPELELMDKLAFKPCGLETTNVEQELESREYFAHTFQLEGQNMKFRKAKITPTKKVNLLQFGNVAKTEQQHHWTFQMIFIFT